MSTVTARRDEMFTLECQRERCKEDLFWFIDMVLRPVCPPDEDRGMPGEFDLSNARHFQWMYKLIKGDDIVNADLMKFGTYRLASAPGAHNRKLGLVPRYHGKTTVGTVAFTMWYLLRNPNARVLIISQTWDNARGMLGMIKDLYVKIKESANSINPIPFWIMGDWQGSMWNEDAIIVKPRTRSDITPSVATAGIDKEVTSKHFDLIICDDLVGKENTQTDEQIQKTIKSFTSMSEVGDTHQGKSSLFLLWGTCWNYGDLYNHIQENLAPHYDILRLRCWDDDNNPQELLFPEKFTAEYLQNVKAEKMASDPLQWDCQYLNTPIPRDRAFFPVNNIQFYEHKDLLLDNGKMRKFSIVICVDPALSENKWSCYTAIVPVAVDDFGRRYLLPYYRFKQKDPAKVANEIIRFAKQYRRQGLVMVGVEEGTLFNTLEPHLVHFANWLPLVPLKIENKNKSFKMMQLLQPYIVTKRIYMQRNMTEMIQQMVRFPLDMKNVDLLEAFAYHGQLIPDYHVAPGEYEKHMTNDELFWKFATESGEPDRRGEFYAT